ncbi:MAG: Uma2 family endonuclease [Pseudanabaena sp.]|jgi:Uma2 family endonuclease
MVAITEPRSLSKSTDSNLNDTNPHEPEIIYPTSDGEPLAETQEHSWAILMTLNLLSQYLTGKQAVVFANQFFYYIEKKPTARVAPDVMVIFDIPVKMYGNYKLWEDQQTPAIIFEMTSKGTKETDLNFKKTLYEQLGIQEYWLFDPYGEWIPEHLRGYRLNDEGLYKPIKDNCSEVLQLRLQPDGYLLSFYRLDNNQKLLTPDELLLASQEARQQVEEAMQQVEEATRQAQDAMQQAQDAMQQAQAEKSRADRLAEKLRQLGVEL